MEVGRLATQRRRKGEGGLVEGWRDKNSPHSSPEKLKKKPTTGQVVKIGKLYQSYLDPHVPPESELLQRHTVPFFFFFVRCDSMEPKNAHTCTLVPPFHQVVRQQIYKYTHTRTLSPCYPKKSSIRMKVQ